LEVAVVPRNFGKTEGREGQLLSSGERNKERPPDCPRKGRLHPGPVQPGAKRPQDSTMPANYTPKLKKRTALLGKLRDVFRRFASQPVGGVVERINPILRGWVNYFAVSHSSRCLSFVKTG
jgi:hypothetical protein